jgi:hypothetical protein
MRAAAEAALRNVTRPHRPRTYWKAGRARARNDNNCHVSSLSKYLKAPLVEDSEGVAGLKWTGGASAISGTITPTLDMAELTVSYLIVTAGHWVLINGIIIK